MPPKASQPAAGAPSTSDPSNNSSAHAPTLKVKIPKWLPYASRLQVTADKQTVEQKPILAFSELPPHEVDRKSFAGQLEPGTVNDYPDVSVENLGFFKKNKQTLLDIVWPADAFNPSTPLTLNNQQLIFVGSAPNIPASYITIRVVDMKATMNTEEKIKAFAVVLQNFFTPHTILDFWTTHTEIRIPSRPTPQSAWNQEMFLLVDLNLKDGPTFWGSNQPADVASLLPGWVEFDQMYLKLEYADRFDHCMFCKTPNTEDRHTYKECNARLCSFCQDPGHLRRFCPEAKPAEAARAEASKREQLAATESQWKELSATYLPAKRPRPNGDDDDIQVD
ncbi:uncharacterized protein UBRO2_05809 [Ustilago bromivora]|uniref:CCHC-type domain-containing protein n=1 Tax=Ustilago bromivora TaxID=307758 RepID=A0A8H8QUA9_9BASI|nr:uncharacterized protein UBRO2_05809 [Ustilago bromivora]